MEIFFSSETDEARCMLHKKKTFHCVKVLRYKEGDELFVVDGKGFLYRCELAIKSPDKAECRILEIYFLIHIIGLAVFLIPLLLTNMAVLKLSGADRGEQAQGLQNLRGYC